MARYNSTPPVVPDGHPVALQSDVSGNLRVTSPAPLTNAGGLTQFSLVSAATTNATVVKATPGRVYGYSITNNNAATRYVKIYNKATAPTIGTDVPLRRIAIPANQTVQYHAPAGLAGFTAGIGIGTTTGGTDADTAAVALADLLINIDYA